MITAVLLSTMMIFAAAPSLGAHADDDRPTFEVSSHTVNAGDEVAVTIEAKNNPGIVCFRLSVNYDKNNMTLVNAVERDFSGVMFAKYEKVPFKFLWLDVANGDKTINGPLAELTFKVNPGAADAVYPIEISYEPNDVNNFNEQQVHFEIVNGSITVGEGGDTVSLPDNTSSSAGGSGGLPSGGPDFGRRPTEQRPSGNSSTAEFSVDKTASELMEEVYGSSVDRSSSSKKDKSSSDESGESSSSAKDDESGSAESEADTEIDSSSADSEDTSTAISQSESESVSSGNSTVRNALIVTGVVVALAAITGAVIVVRKKKL